MARPHRHTRWRFDRFAFDPARRELVLDGRRRLLEDKLVALLLYLLEHADQVVDRRSLREQVWPGQVVTDGAIAKAERTSGHPRSLAKSSMCRSPFAPFQSAFP